MALDPSVSLGRTVRALRERAGHSQEAFAHVVGVHRTYMGTLERGRANPTLRIIDRIARGLGVTVPELFRAIEESDRADPNHPLAEWPGR